MGRLAGDEALRERLGDAGRASVAALTPGPSRRRFEALYERVLGAAAMTPRRIHVTGGQGSGKTTLAARLHAVTGLPVHELDRIARIGGGNGPERPAAERDAMVSETIAAGDAWITEGVHLGWTDRCSTEPRSSCGWITSRRPGHPAAWFAGSWRVAA